MNSTLAIIDYRAPHKAIDKLGKYVEDIHLFESNGITYNSISGHPDVFMFQDENNLVIAPNSPSPLIDFLKKYNVTFATGKAYVGDELENSVLYNCVGTENCLIHKEGFTDEAIIKLLPGKKLINVSQSYTRCSLLHIGEKNFVTSDKGIEKVLLGSGFNCFYFHPRQIKIHDHEHGFFGGAAGMLGNKLFTIGNIKKHRDGIKLLKLLDELQIELISLCDDFLYDGGGIFFFN